MKGTSGLSMEEEDQSQKQRYAVQKRSCIYLRGSFVKRLIKNYYENEL